MKRYFEISVWCTYDFQALWVYIKSRSDANRCLQRETFRLLYRWSWCNILVFLPHCLSPHFWGNKPALIGCLSQECNLTQVEQHLIAICIFPPLSSIGRKNLKGGQRKLRLCYVEIYPFCVAAALVISPANENCRLIAKWKKKPKTNPKAGCGCVMWIGLDCFSVWHSPILFATCIITRTWSADLVRWCKLMETAVHWILLNSSYMACLCLCNRTN